MFLGRQSELTYLQQYLDQKNGVLGVIYGIRQVGKTSLLKQIVIKNHGIYYVADHSGQANNLTELGKIVTQHFQDPPFLFTSYYDLFTYLLRQEQTTTTPIILVIDEFSYILETNPEIASVFQKIKDEYLKSSSIKIILAGSHLGLMSQIGQYHHPLYQRITFKKKIEPFDYYEAALFYPHLTALDKIKFYSVFGGMPWVLQCLNANHSLWQNLHNLLKQPNFTENILFSWLGHNKKLVAPYEPILKSLAGMRDCQMKEISAKTNKTSAAITPLIKNLITMGLVGKTVLFGQNFNASKKTKYFLKEPFFNFYYHFIKKNESAYIISPPSDFVTQYIEPTWDLFIGISFEKICRQFMMRKYQLNTTQSQYQLGSYWHNDTKQKINYDIDLIFRPNLKELVFFECKWQNRLFYQPLISKLKHHVQQLQNSKLGVFTHHQQITYGFFLKHNFEDANPSTVIIYTLADLYPSTDQKLK